MLPRLSIPTAYLLMIAVFLFSLFGMALAAQLENLWLLVLVALMGPGCLLAIGRWLDRS